MRPQSIAGLILIILGVLMISVHSVTYFTNQTEVGPLGFFAWDVSQPHTIFVNPVAGLVAIAIGAGLMFMTRGRTI
jgi:hypothetical protein